VTYLMQFKVSNAAPAPALMPAALLS